MSFNKRKRPDTTLDDAAIKEGSDSELQILSKKPKASNSSGVAVIDGEDRKVHSRDIISSTLSENLSTNDHATTLISVDTEISKDSRSIRERNIEIGNKVLSGELESGLYRGKLARTLVGKSTGTFSSMGPVRGQQYAKASSRIDYQPDICKDYKETGYCGWGDTCVFLHDRSEHKSSWQIDRDYEALQRKKDDKRAEIFARRLRGEQVDSEEEMAALEPSNKKGDQRTVNRETTGVPFACLICKIKWTPSMKPVVTRCNHYFCQKCVTEQLTKSEKCYTCQTPTLGIFKSADNVVYDSDE